MPIEWNYGYCEGLSEARVLFKYPSDTDWNTVISKSPPIDHKCEVIQGQGSVGFTGGQCVCVRYNVTIRYFDPQHQGGSYLTIGKRFWGAITGATRVVVIDHRWQVQIESRGLAEVSACNVPSYYSMTTGGVNSGANPARDVSFVSVVRVDNQPDNCGNPPGGETQYKFTVTDKSGIIYTRTTADSCPLVEVECGKKCPPNTCECRHGKKVCCYGTNGIIVTSFDA